LGREQPLLGVTLIDWAAQNRLFDRQDVYETAIVETIRAFNFHYDGHAILFSQVRGPTLAEDDRVPARRVKERLADLGNQVTIIEREVTPEVLKAAYGLMRIFIGTRLHSNIFALTEGVPTIMIQYQYKTRGVGRMLGLERWVLDVGEVEASVLGNLVHKLWREQVAVRAHLATVLPAVIQRSSQPVKEIAADMKTR
jgi:colanic acid/amylovoran biosynthesis protein